MSPTPDELERLLRAARPTPRPAFVRELERSLPVRRSERSRARLRVAIAGSGLVAALAGVAIALGVTGLLPFTSGGGPGAHADENCRRVLVERSERQPYFVRDRSGQLQVRYRVKTVPRFITRCR